MAAASSVTRALRIMEAVAAAGDGITPKAIARRLGCPLPTVYRALGTLVEQGYLVRLHEVRGYGLGYRVAELQHSLAEQVRPPAAVRTVLHEVHLELGAAAYLVARRDADVVVAHVDDCPEHPLAPGLRAGEPTAPHATAAGKAVLSGLRGPRLTELLGRVGLPALAPHTVADRRGLDRELRRVRAEGVAVEVEEYAAGVAGLAVPVLGPDGEVVAGLGVSVSRADFAARRWELERGVRRAGSRVAALPVG
ncbi:IclR family transcriptional regulator [Pseudonocardia humida]|nr:IclR family transcriptional regulator [Pseudonocardia humida]